MVQHLLAIDDVNEDFERILKWAIEFKRLWKQGDEVALNFLPLDTLAIGSIYEKPSTRTRVSFEVGIQRLGGSALTLLKTTSNSGPQKPLATRLKCSLGSWVASPTVALAMRMLPPWPNTQRCPSSTPFLPSTTPARQPQTS